MNSLRHFKDFLKLNSVFRTDETESECWRKSKTLWDPHLTLDLGIARFRFRRAVDFAIKQVFAFLIIHQGHERKEINLCLAAFIDPPLEN